MSAKDLDKAYEDELEAARDRGAVIEFPPARERRGCPRIRVAADSGEAAGQLRSYVIDVSASGVGVCVSEPARDGDCLHIIQNEKEPACISVVGCRFSTFDSETLITYYRLNCTAENETAGKQLLVNLLQHGDKGLRFVRP